MFQSWIIVQNALIIISALNARKETTITIQSMEIVEDHVLPDITRIQKILNVFYAQPFLNSSTAAHALRINARHAAIQNYQ